MELYSISVVGVMVHGVGNYAYHYSKRFAHDSSLVASIIVDVLRQVKNARGLPRKLYIQLDNCVRENKNRNVLGILAVLIMMGWLDEVLDHQELLGVDSGSGCRSKLASSWWATHMRTSTRSSASCRGICVNTPQSSLKTCWALGPVHARNKALRPQWWRCRRLQM